MTPLLQPALLLLTTIYEAICLSGRMCMTVELYRVADNSNEFYECAPLTQEEATEYNLTDKYSGVWNLRYCPESYEFDVARQKCTETRAVRRQQTTCAQNSSTVDCQVSCSGALSEPIIGSPCDWKEAALKVDPTSNAHFIQCSPQSSSAVCGEWTRIPCAPNTVFSPSSSICVSITVDRSVCEPQQEAVCSCSQTTGATQCPGINSACAPGIGCCPVSVNQPTQTIQIALCPDSLSPPLGPCGSCPVGASCNTAINACCPVVSQPSTDFVYNVYQLCPNGAPAQQPCSAGCPPNNGCYQGVCCPMICPVGQTALGFCTTDGCASGSCYLPGGCCCQEIVKLPVCANGQQSQRKLITSKAKHILLLIKILLKECGPRMECSNGGCCPMPFCPTGIQAQMRCAIHNMVCPTGYVCLEGLCCPLPRCPNGIISLGVCTTSLDCGRMGVECANGACCPLPTCSNNIVSIQRCALGCANCCPIGHSCMNGGCCPLPLCPAGNFLLYWKRIQCENGVCCAMPVCSTGLIAASVCGIGNSCQIGFVCEGRGCCQEPPPPCPNGGRAVQRCNRGADCPPGFGCTQLGGCCLLSMEPVCPTQSNAICQCSQNNACPKDATCIMGTCCSKCG
uniref:EB domain-containing protein n=1 Tax=Angiostrongylus cantonensis TaxID=6313 RepID=A0A0K0DN63_ANGCA